MHPFGFGPHCLTWLQDSSLNSDQQGELEMDRGGNSNGDTVDLAPNDGVYALPSASTCDGGQSNVCAQRSTDVK